MAQQVTLGGERLGSGNKQKVELHNYQMTSFNLDQDFKSTMAPGVLYPFLRSVATNHGTYDIDLDTLVRTLPTKGPLLGSYKLQCDIFAVPFRLYQGILHNNPIKVGLNMDKIILPKLNLIYTDGPKAPRAIGSDEDSWQVNPTALLKYNGISGIGRAAYIQGSEQDTMDIVRKIQCIPELAYYDIFKNYYANKQEEKAYVITPGEAKEVNELTMITQGNPEDPIDEYYPYDGEYFTIRNNNAWSKNFEIFLYNYGKTKAEVLTKTIISDGNTSISIFQLQLSTAIQVLAYETLPEGNPYGNIQMTISITNTNIFAEFFPDLEICFRSSLTDNEQKYYTSDIQLTPFSLENIDDMRNALLSSNTIGSEFILGLTGNWNKTSGTDETGLPYSTLFSNYESGLSYNAFTMNGLCVKTYQSDLFNNWLDTEYIDGENGISAISSVAVVNDKFSMDSLNLAEKIYEYLNRVLVSGGTYEDWQEATYGEGAVRKAETPMYVGGMSSEILFDEVVATSDNNTGNQKLGELAGRGRQTGIKGGNNIHIKCDEPSYIIGIVSITPRICYSQGNDWDRTELDTMDDLHKPALDGIGFQNLMVEQMAWWNTAIKPGTNEIVNRSVAGKQIAWLNYQTAVDKCYGDFAKQDGYGFMVLSRHYEHSDDNLPVNRTIVRDITTYIDPAKYNYVFAYDKIDAQNFWVQVHAKVVARRKMAGKQIPNL